MEQFFNYKYLNYNGVKDNYYGIVVFGDYYANNNLLLKAKLGEKILKKIDYTEENYFDILENFNINLFNISVYSSAIKNFIVFDKDGITFDTKLLKNNFNIIGNDINYGITTNSLYLAVLDFGSGEIKLEEIINNKLKKYVNEKIDEIVDEQFKDCKTVFIKKLDYDNGLLINKINYTNFNCGKLKVNFSNLEK